MARQAMLPEHLEEVRDYVTQKRECRPFRLSFILSVEEIGAGGLRLNLKTETFHLIEKVILRAAA